MRRIPYGVMNYEELVRECYFVDNTKYLRELEQVKTPVFLRPKRFGKSVWCSVLAHYYDVNLKDRFQELFGETDIGRNPTPLANSFLVLRFDFSTIEVEYNTPAGRCDFLAVPKPGLAKDAMLVEFKYFTKKDGAARLFADENREPDAETFAQAERYRASLPARPGWNHAVETAVVEVYADLGYRWFPV